MKACTCQLLCLFFLRSHLYFPCVDYNLQLQAICFVEYVSLRRCILGLERECMCCACVCVCKCVCVCECVMCVSVVCVCDFESECPCVDVCE